MPHGRRVPKLRVKTGCQTCRTRKKKCDEGCPVCKRCAMSGFQCHWPTPTELADRRYGSIRRQEVIAMTKTKSNARVRSSLEVTRVSPTSASTDHDPISYNVEVMLFQHFSAKYYSLIMLPTSQTEYYWSLFHKIQRLLPGCRSLQHAVLASAASHLYSIDKSARMQELALVCYSQALRDLQDLLGTNSHVENHDGLLISVMLLYVLGSTGESTYSDIPRHIDAAVKLVTLRSFTTPTTISRPFERLVMESVLHSMFLVTTGLWSEKFDPDKTFDMAFWLQAEHLLDGVDTLPDPMPSDRHPVVGFPVSLLRLVLSIRQFPRALSREYDDALIKLKRQVAIWEPYIMCTTKGEYPQLQVTRDATALYIIIVSILSEQIQLGLPSTTTVPPSTHEPDNWKLRHALSLLQRYRHDETWHRMYTLNFAVYTIGFFVMQPADVDLIRYDLQRRWEATRFSYIERYRCDLEAVWEQRGVN